MGVGELYSIPIGTRTFRSCYDCGSTFIVQHTNHLPRALIKLIKPSLAVNYRVIRGSKKQLPKAYRDIWMLDSETSINREPTSDILPVCPGLLGLQIGFLFKNHQDYKFVWIFQFWILCVTTCLIQTLINIYCIIKRQE